MADGVDPPHHPLNPVKRDQVFFNCTSCVFSKNWRGHAGACGHPDHELILAIAIPSFSGMQFAGKLQVGQQYSYNYGAPEVPFAMKVENGGGASMVNVAVPAPVTDLMACSDYKELGTP